MVAAGEYPDDALAIEVRQQSASVIVRSSEHQLDLGPYLQPERRLVEYSFSLSRLRETRMVATLQKTGGYALGVGGVAAIGVAVVPLIIGAGVAAAVATPIVLIPAGLFACQEAYYLLQHGGRDYKRAITRERLNQIVTEAVGLYCAGKLPEFLHKLAEPYDEEENRRLIKLEPRSYSIEPDSMCEVLLAYDFRPDGIGYLFNILAGALARVAKRHAFNEKYGERRLLNSADSLLDRLIYITALDERATELDHRRADNGYVIGILDRLTEFSMTVGEPVGQQAERCSQENSLVGQGYIPVRARLAEMRFVAAVNRILLELYSFNSSVAVAKQRTSTLSEMLSLLTKTSHRHQFFAIAKLRLEAVAHLLSALGCDDPIPRRFYINKTYMRYEAPTSGAAQLALPSGEAVNNEVQMVEHYTILGGQEDRPLQLLNLLTAGKFSLSVFELQQKLVLFCRHPQHPEPEVRRIADKLLQEFPQRVRRGAELLREDCLPVLSQVLQINFVICRVTEREGLKQYQTLESDGLTLPRDDRWPTVFLAKPQGVFDRWAVFSTRSTSVVSQCTRELTPLRLVYDNKGHNSTISLPLLGGSRQLNRQETEQLFELYVLRADDYFSQAEAIDETSHPRALVYYAKAQEDYRHALSMSTSSQRIFIQKQPGIVFRIARCLLKQSQAQQVLDFLREKNEPALGLQLASYEDYYYLQAVAYRLLQNYEEAAHNITRCLFATTTSSAYYQQYRHEMRTINGLISRSQSQDEQPEAVIRSGLMQLPDTGDVTASAAKNTTDPYHILSLDGGRGLFLAVILDQLESELPGTLVSYFNLVAGSGVGGTLALLLSLPKPVQQASTHQTVSFSNTEPRYTTNDVLAIFSDPQRRSGFLPASTGFFSSAKQQQQEVVKGWTAGAKMSDLLTGVVIPTTKADGNYTASQMFSNLRRYSRDTDCDVADVMLSSIAPPHEGHPVDIGGHTVKCWDGGYCANNPAQLAFEQATTIRSEGYPVDPERVYVWSIGALDVTSETAREHMFAHGRSRHCPLGGQQNNVDDSLPCKLYDASRYQRFQFWSEKIIKPTDFSPKTVAFLKNAAHDVVEKVRYDGRWQRMIDCLAPS